MLIVLGSIVLCGASISFVAMRHFRLQKPRSGVEDLQPLSPNMLHILRRINIIPLWRRKSIGEVSFSELFLALRNFRALSHEADRIRLEDPENREEFSSIHATRMRNSRDMTLRFIFAILEKTVNRMFGSTSQFCAYATLASYSEEVEIVAELMELGGDGRSRELEAHLK